MGFGDGLDFGLDAMDAGNYRGTFSGAPLTDTSWTTMAAPGAGVSDAKGGGWFSDFTSAAKSLWGSSATKSEGGSGALGLFSDLGSVAKNVLPLASIGTGIASLMNQRDAMKQLDRKGQTVERATNAQVEAAEAARPMADAAASLAPDIREVAGKVDPLAERAAGVAPEIRSLNDNYRSTVVDPTTQMAMGRLAAVRRGEIPPGIQAQLQQLEQGEIQQMRDYMARAGMGDSSSLQQLEAAAKERTQARAAKYLQDEEKIVLGYLDQIRAGTATAGSLYGAETAALGTSANIYGSEVNDLARAGEVLGIGGNILAGSGRTAAGASQTAQQEQQQIEALIAAVQAQLAKLSGSQN